VIHIQTVNEDLLNYISYQISEASPNCGGLLSKQRANKMAAGGADPQMILQQELSFRHFNPVWEAFKGKLPLVYAVCDIDEQGTRITRLSGYKVLLKFMERLGKIKITQSRMEAIHCLNL